MPGFLHLPREVRNIIYGHLLTAPDGLPLIAVTKNKDYTPATDGLIRDMQSFSADHTRVHEVWAAFRSLRGVNHQLAEEALEEFAHNNYLSVRIGMMDPDACIAEAFVIPYLLVHKFREIHLASPRSSGYWPADGGGPDLHVVLATLPSPTTPGSRTIQSGKTMSGGAGAEIVAKAACRLAGRTLDEALLNVFVSLLHFFAQKS